MGRFRRGTVAALAVVLLLGGGVVLAATQAPRALEVLATRTLRDAGFPRARAEFGRVGLDGAGLRVVLDPGSGDRLGTVDVGWSVRGLLALELDRLEIRDADLTVRLLPDGTTEIAGLPLGAASPGQEVGEEPASPWSLPLREAALRDTVLRIEGGETPVVMTVDARLRRTAPADGGEEGNGTGERVRLSAAAHGTIGSASLKLSGPLRELEGTFQVDIRDLPLTAGVVSSARLAGDVTLEPEAVQVSLREPWLLAGRLPETWTVGAVPLSQGPLSVMIGPLNDEPLILTWRSGNAASRAETGAAAVRIEGGQGETVDLQVGPAAVSWTDAGIQAFDAGLLAIETSEFLVGDMRLAIPHLELGLTGSADELRAHLGDGSVVLPDYAVAVTGVGGSAELGVPEPGAVTADLRIGRLAHGASPAFVAPLSAALTARGRIDGAVDLAGKVSGAIEGRIRGRHDFASGAGSVRVEVPPLLLGPGGRPADEVSPWLARQVEDAGGTVGLDLRAGWGGAGPEQGRAELLLRDISFVAGAVAVEDMNTVLRADSLMPLVLPPGQEVAVGVIDVGVPLTNGLIRFAIGPDGRLDVGQASWDWAGGVVRAQPFSLDFADPEGMVVLDAQRLDLGRLLVILPVEGLTGTGTLAGSLPVRISGDSVGVVQGSLETVAPGTLRYLPEEPPDFLTGEGGAGMLLDALTDFRYETLALAVDGTAGGEMVVGLKIRGSNPDFYDGYPVALNLNVSGALDTILRRGLSAYRIPEAVRDRMSEFENRVE